MSRSRAPAPRSTGLGRPIQGHATSGPAWERALPLLPGGQLQQSTPKRIQVPCARTPQAFFGVAPMQRGSWSPRTRPPTRPGTRVCLNAMSRHVGGVPRLSRCSRQAKRKHDGARFIAALRCAPNECRDVLSRDLTRALDSGSGIQGSSPCSPARPSRRLSRAASPSPSDPGAAAT